MYKHARFIQAPQVEASGSQNHSYSELENINPYEDSDKDGYYLNWEGKFIGQIGNNEATNIYRTDQSNFDSIKAGGKGFARKLGTLEDYKYLLGAVHGETLKAEDAKETLKERIGIAHAILNWKSEKGNPSIQSAATQIANVFRDGNGRTNLIMKEWAVTLLKSTQTEDIEISKKAVFEVLSYLATEGKAGTADNTGGANSWDGLVDLKRQYTNYSNKKTANKWNKFEKGFELNHTVEGVKSVKNAAKGYMYRSTKIIGNTIFAKYSGD